MQSSNAELLARLWTQAQPNVKAFLLSIVHDFHLAEDVLQDVAVVALREFEKYDPSRPFLPWVIVIAKNCALTTLKARKKTFNELFEEDLLEQIQAGFVRNSDTLDAMRRALHFCLSKQRKKVREVLIWRYAHDLKPRDIAVRMGMTSSAIRSLLHRARILLEICVRRNWETV